MLSNNKKSIKYGVAIAGVQNDGPGSGSIWKSWAEKKGKIADSSIPTNGVGFYTKYKEDIQLAKEMGLKVFRFSIDWARVEPKKGDIDQIYLDHCQSVINEIENKGMEAFVTLFHFDYPQWFQVLGGFTRKSNFKYFLSFIEIVVSRFAGQVDTWMSLNEPVNWAFHSYLYGDFSPGEKNLIKTTQVINNLIDLNNQCYRLIKKLDSKALVGVGNNMNWFKPFNINSVIENKVATLLNWFWNWRYIDKTINCCDFVGVQYYARIEIQTRLGGNLFGLFQERGLTLPTGKVKISDLGWDIVPKGLEYFLKKVWLKYHKPIYITEVGLAEAGISDGFGLIVDQKREEYVKQIVDIVNQAVESGIEVLGVVWWTLTDNWEWTLGFSPKFGFYRVDPNGLRVPRESVSTLKQIIGE